LPQGIKQMAKGREKVERKPRSDDVTVNTGGLKSSIGFSLRRAQLSMYGDFVHFMKHLEVRPSQFAVLVLLLENPGISPSSVSFTLGIQKANFVSLNYELERRGLVERRRLSHDRRAIALHLTPLGQSFSKKVVSAHAKLEKSLADRLGPKDSALFLEFLNRFADSVRPPSVL